MNIPVEVARAQGKHGDKCAAHGIKGGRPRLDLTEEQRVERRRKQKEAYRRKKGILPMKQRRTPKWVSDYFEVWGKLPGAASDDGGIRGARTVVEPMGR